MKMFLTLFLLTFVNMLYSQNIKNEPIQFDTVYTKPEVQASFPGGEEKWKQYVKKNLKYPRKAWWDEIESEAVLKLIIEKDGTISEVIHLTNSVYGFEQEAIRLVRKSGKWKPAMHRGRAVKSEGVLTMEFRLR